MTGRDHELKGRDRCHGAIRVAAAAVVVMAGKAAVAVAAAAVAAVAAAKNNCGCASRTG